MDNELELLLNKKKLYWKQRSRMDWLHHGYRNSKFFHRKASARKVNNTMHGLFDDNGNWRTDNEVPQIHTVSNLIIERKWNLSLLEEFFNPVDGEAIQSIPLGKFSTPDHQYGDTPSMVNIVLNLDTVVNNEEGVISIGAVIRNHRGKVVGSLGKVVNGNYSSLTAEMLAIKEGLKFAAEIGLRVHIAETDSLLSVQIINLHFLFSPVLNVAEDCRLLMA
ncbi:unnamed protein product [Fraxinus pennsylvanica]|uniref:RNase H type-1 domain-containing protein n=1 Tax=Fraxinus pennsylvanica TaxID=56036 RepID=A0AAD1YLP3_9LAMI|nr:unnamed protein product [Fraxinus pennsylvanica]